MKAMKTRSLYAAVIASLGAASFVFNSSAAETIETVAIAVEPCDGNPEGKLIVNKVDYDPRVHKLYEEPKGAKAKKPVSGGKQDGNDDDGNDDDGNDDDKPVFSDMTRDQITEWLAARGVSHAKNISGVKLVELAEETYAESKK